MKLTETLGPKTIREVHSVLHVALKRAVKTKLLPFNPADGCDLPRVDTKEAVALSAEQLEAYQKKAAGSWVDLLNPARCRDRRPERRTARVQMVGSRLVDVEVKD